MLGSEYISTPSAASATVPNTGTARHTARINPANFLNAFVEEGTKWIHLDIAGTADNDGTGATGAMIRSVVNMFSK